MNGVSQRITTTKPCNFALIDLHNTLSSISSAANVRENVLESTREGHDKTIVSKVNMYRTHETLKMPLQLASRGARTLRMAQANKPYKKPHVGGVDMMAVDNMAARSSSKLSFDSNKRKKKKEKKNKGAKKHSTNDTVMEEISETEEGDADEMGGDDDDEIEMVPFEFVLLAISSHFLHRALLPLNPKVEC